MQILFFFFKDLVGKSLLCYISSAWTYLLYSQYRIESGIRSKWLLIHEIKWWRLRVGKVPKRRAIEGVGSNGLWPLNESRGLQKHGLDRDPAARWPVYLSVLRSLRKRLSSGSPLAVWPFSWDFMLEGMSGAATDLHNGASYSWHRGNIRRNQYLFRKHLPTEVVSKLFYDGEHPLKLLNFSLEVIFTTH